MPAQRRAAFFDLDRTFLDCNSGLLYAKWEFQRGTISLWQMVRVLVWGIGYHFSLINIDRAYQEAVTLYIDEPEANVRQWTQEWFAQMIQGRAQPGALSALNRHRTAGEPCVLLTSSSCYAAECASNEWGFDDWLANKFSKDETGRLDGSIHAPLCYGTGKIHYAERWAKRQGISLEESVFYTDSYSDLPMLERVGEPVVVNPDPRLRRVAKARGWRIENWTQSALTAADTV